MKLEIIEKFAPLFKGELSSKRLLIYYGGRGGGKTDQLTIYFILQTLEQENINILVLRASKESQRNSLVENFRFWLNELDLSNAYTEKKELLFKQYTTTILNTKTNSKIIFSGATKQTIINLKSISNIKYCWVEEAVFLTDEIYSVLAPTIRAKNSQIFLSLNPQDETDYIYQTYIKGKEINDFLYLCKINYYDNKYFPPSLERERLFDLKNKPRSLYLHIWEGEPQANNELKIIDINKIGRFDDTQKQKGKYSKIILVIDSAFSTKASADYSVVGAYGKIDNEIHLFRLLRGRWEFNELIESLKSLYFWTSQHYGVVDKIIIEKKASGQSLIQEILRLTTLQVFPVEPTTDKYTRLTEVISDLPKLKLPFSDDCLNYWIKDFLQEAKEFRADLKHAHDDQIDTMIYALKEMQEDKVDWRSLSENLRNKQQRI